MTRRILVTRPAAQAERLCAMIEAAGAEPVRLPAIEIHGLEDSSRLEALLTRLDSLDLAVFVSVNAVEAALPFILARRGWPKQLKIAAVGPTSTDAIARYGLAVDYVPPHDFSSEGLLALEGLQDMQGKKVVIFRGNGGRSKLYDSFTGRGAEVIYAEVYSRNCPVMNFRTVKDLLAQENLDIVLATSNETLQNLLLMAGPEGAPLLREKLLVVPGQRQLELAQQLGFSRTPVLAGNASDEAMAAAVKKILARKDA